MRVGVDARHLTAGRGVARYSGAILTALADGYPGDEWHLLAPGSRGTGHPLLDEPRRNVVVRRTRTPGRALYGGGAVCGRPRLDRLLGDLDVFFAPAVAPLTLSARTPLVLTVHDLAFEHRPGDFTPYERLWHRLARVQRIAARAAELIAVSAETRDEIAHEWAISAARVTVARPGLSHIHPPPPEDVPKALGRLGVEPPYLLCVGALEPRKAPLPLAAAHARARALGLKAGLVFAGAGRLEGELRATGAQVLGRVDDADLACLYRGALALVMPSHLEGFGLPPLEALALGTPSVVTDLPVFAETLGDAALRFAPGDEAALARALLEIEAHGDLRAHLVSAGAARVAGLTWDASAAVVHATLERAAAAR